MSEFSDIATVAADTLLAVMGQQVTHVAADGTRTDVPLAGFKEKDPALRNEQDGQTVARSASCLVRFADVAKIDRDETIIAEGQSWIVKTVHHHEQWAWWVLELVWSEPGMKQERNGLLRR